MPMQVAEVLNEALLCVGFFTLFNTSNQEKLHWGRAPSLLQRLCAVPFPYFVEPVLSQVRLLNYDTLFMCSESLFSEEWPFACFCLSMHPIFQGESMHLLRKHYCLCTVPYPSHVYVLSHVCVCGRVYQWFCFQNQMKYVWDTFILWKVFLIVYINNFRGDQTDIIKNTGV